VSEVIAVGVKDMKQLGDMGSHVGLLLIVGKGDYVSVVRGDVVDYSGYDILRIITVEVHEIHVACVQVEELVTRGFPVVTQVAEDLRFWGGEKIRQMIQAVYL